MITSLPSSPAPRSITRVADGAKGVPICMAGFSYTRIREMSTAEPRSTPRRDVHRADALAWLAAHAPKDDMAVVTSLPDFSELRELTFEAWQSWFVGAA